MNCPSYTDELSEHQSWNQSPPTLAADLTTRQDLNGIANLRLQRGHMFLEPGTQQDVVEEISNKQPSQISVLSHSHVNSEEFQEGLLPATCLSISHEASAEELVPNPPKGLSASIHHFGRVLVKFGKFVGPGFMISVAYIDPGNYSTDVAAGASSRFQLLFVVLMSNIFAIVLQSLAVRLGTVTGLNLAEHCRAHLPRWLNLALYILAEAAIIATDIAEVIGSAIALNLLLKVPLVAGCAITLVDVLIILIFYSPNGSMKRLRAFEFFIVALVLGVVVCFCIQLSLIKDTPVDNVFKGYLPSSTIVKGKGIYLSCGILGATVMPHSLYLGSGIVQSRLRDFDCGGARPAVDHPKPQGEEEIPYRPSLAAIRSCMTYSTMELGLSLFTFALFVNSAILIVAGASLSSTPGAETANLFSIHDLLSKTIAPVAGTIFALALLISGTSAGIICTIAGQMVSEGALNWTLAPWKRRLLTRSISITPSIIIAGAVGKEGLSAALNGTQVALSIILPFVSAPLIYFTCRNKYMTIREAEPVVTGETDQQGEMGVRVVEMRNHWGMTGFATVIWLIMAVMNVALLVLLGLGKA